MADASCLRLSIARKLLGAMVITLTQVFEMPLVSGYAVAKYINKSIALSQSGAWSVPRPLDPVSPLSLVQFRTVFLTGSQVPGICSRYAGQGVQQIILEGRSAQNTRQKARMAWVDAS